MATRKRSTPADAEAQRLADIAAGAAKLKTHARTPEGTFKPSVTKAATGRKK